MIKDLTVVIPVYGQHHHLAKLLESIEGQIPHKNIVIAEDGSPYKDTREFVCKLKKYGYVTRCYKENVGFGKNVNRAVKLAKTKYILIINSDVYFDSKITLKDCMEKMRRDDEIGVMGIRLMFPNKLVQHAGCKVDWGDRGGNTITIGQYDRMQDCYRHYEEKEFVTGAFMILRKETWDEMGGFAECYGRGYYEDPELCVALRERGYKVMYNGEVYAYHIGGESFRYAGLSSQTYDNFRTWQERNLEVLKEWAGR